MQSVAVEQVPIDDYEIPLGKAEVLIPGADLTLLTWGTPIYHCETAVHMLSNPPDALAPHVPSGVRSAKVELLDLRSCPQPITDDASISAVLTELHVSARRTWGLSSSAMILLLDCCIRHTSKMWTEKKLTVWA